MMLERYTDTPRVYAGSGVLSAQGWLYASLSAQVAKSRTNLITTSVKDRVNALIHIAITGKDELIMYWEGNHTLQRCVRYRGERLNTISELLLDVREN